MITPEDKDNQRSSSRRKKRASLLRTSRYYYLRLLRLEGKPVVIARGLACGVFAGCFPWFGLQTIIGVMLAFIFRGNKLAAALGTWVSNPLTYAPIFLFNYKIGELIQNNPESESVQFQLDGSSWSDLIDLGSSIIVSLFIGSFIVGLIAGILTYFISLHLINRRISKRNLY